MSIVPLLLGLGAIVLLASRDEKKSAPSSPIPSPSEGGTSPIPVPSIPVPPIPQAPPAGGLWTEISKGIEQGVSSAGKAVTDLFGPGAQPGVPAPSAPATSKWDACFDPSMSEDNKAMARALLAQAEATGGAMSEYFLRAADAYAKDFPLFAECLRDVALGGTGVED